MKGTPQFPMCGFSSRTVQALKAAGDTDLHTVNVLEDPEIRANLPRYSNWPTFPQLFIHGELIGGCDITMELYESGELDALSRRRRRPELLPLADRGRARTARWLAASVLVNGAQRRARRGRVAGLLRRPARPSCCSGARCRN